MKQTVNSVLQIRRELINKDILMIIFQVWYLHKKHCCDPSLEPSLGDGSNKGSQHKFPLRNKKNHLRLIRKILRNREL